MPAALTFPVFEACFDLCRVQQTLDRMGYRISLSPPRLFLWRLRPAWQN